MSALFRRRARKPEPPPPPIPELPPSLSPEGSQTIYVTGDRQVDTDRIRLLVDSLRDVSSEGDPDELLVVMVDRAVKTVGAERGLLFMADGKGKAPLRVARDDRGRNLPKEASFSTQVVAGVMDGGEPVVLKIEEGGDFDPSQSMLNLSIRAAMCVPLVSGEERLGVLYVDQRASTQTFSRSDLRFFQAFADMLAIVWNNRRVMEERLQAERIAKDLELARSIQADLVPSRPLECGRYTLCGRVDPADETGGDYFDFFETHERKLVMVVGDVSGHGIGAALVMSAARAYLRSFCQTCSSPREILARVNEHLSVDIADGLFMSMFLCVLDLETHAFSYANAGHPGPVLIHADGSTDDLRVTGMALAVDDEAEYGDEGPHTLTAGDTIVLFTDGLNELRKGEDMYGRERAIESMLRHRSGSATDLLEGIFKDALAWTDEESAALYADDLTVAVLRAGS